MATRTVVASSNAQMSKLRARLSEVMSRLVDFIYNAVFQIRTYKKLYPGIMHALIFWGVTTQVLGTAINLLQMQLFIPMVELTFPRGQLYLVFELVMDLAGVAILVGVGMALLRRLVFRPKSLETRWDDIAALILLALIPLVGFTLEGLRLLSAAPEWANWSPVGSLVAAGFTVLGLKPENAIALHTLFFWSHVTLGLMLVAFIPFTKLRHLAYTPLNILFRSPRKAGELENIANIDEAESLGVGKISEFAPRQLLSFDACVRCGRCEDACPAASSGMPFSPRAFIQTLREAMVSSLVQTNGNGRSQLMEATIPDEMIWFCTTCGACQAACPAFVNPIDEIVDMRRYKALTTGKLPKTIADTLRNMERHGNPWGFPPDSRLQWIEELGVREIAPGESTDILFFMGCAAAFDERNKKSTRSFVSLLQKMGVDFAVLGGDEMCCGENARRLGHEALFQELAMQNIETLSKVSYNRIVTQCPHCFNTLKNEYPQVGGTLKVQHYAEYLAEVSPAWQGGAANNGMTDKRVAYHDSCYLGRYNQVYQQPRQALENAGINLTEIAEHGASSFCCGGGGGQMWMETDANTRINQHRLAQAIEANANCVATACPYCLIMFEDAISSKGLSDQMEVFDIAEIIEKQVRA
jgi:Fe-S oxidoreductase/nitrate reductase gamma subunit